MRPVRKPTQDELHHAIQRLGCNKEPHGAAEACNHVAAWLQLIAHQIWEKEIAARNGLSVAAYRRLPKS
jgi:hypothetical protein